MAGVFDELLEQQKQRLAGAAPAPTLDWNSYYSQALAQAQAQDPTFAADYAKLSADAKEELRLDVLGPVEEAISNPDFDVDAVRTAFEQASFEVKIEGTTFSAWRDGELLVRLEHIDTPAENATATTAQMASIVVEVILMVIGLIVQIPAVGTAIKAAITAVAKAIADNPALVTAVTAVAAAWPNGTWATASASWGLILAGNNAGIITRVIRAIMSTMHWWDYALLVLQVLAFIAALVASAGYAAIAKIVVVLTQTARLISKLVNLDAIAALATATA